MTGTPVVLQEVKRDQLRTVTVEDARAELASRFDMIEKHRQRAVADGRAKRCAICGAVMYMHAAAGTTWRGGSGTASASGGGPGARR